MSPTFRPDRVIVHCNKKRKQGRCAKLPRTFDVPATAALMRRKRGIGVKAAARAWPAADRREFYSFFINHCQG
jgi:hypothetical protein